MQLQIQSTTESHNNWKPQTPGSVEFGKHIYAYIHPYVHSEAEWGPESVNLKPHNLKILLRI